MTKTGTLLTAGALLLLAEAWLRRSNPYRLWSSAFDEASVTEPHPTRGWTQRRHLDFVFHHRYLPTPNRVHFNNLGMHSARNYSASKPPDTLRVQLFGCTTAAGWELPSDGTIAAQLEARLRQTLGRPVEVMNASARNYCTAQLYHWYVEELAAYEPDLVIYHFNTNHPRRNITFHESGKSVRFHQPVYTLDPDGSLRLLRTTLPTHPNDMIFLNDRREIERIPGHTDRSFHRWLRDHLHTYCVLDDFLQGPVRLRRFRDRVEIKDIEKREFLPTSVHSLDAMPYQWRSTAAILAKWVEEVHRAGASFLIAPHLAFYHAGAGRLYSSSDHPWGFNYEDIPERRYLPLIAETLGAFYCDTYRWAYEQRIDTTPFSIHPRYAYVTAHGAAAHAAALAEALDGLRAGSTKLAVGP
ncbi:MAG: hypothetical protein HY914_14215 [Desulfomonile tiedjei]|nr:hypothetical protein [Desulfomonile tiedjei]